MYDVMKKRSERDTASTCPECEGVGTRTISVPNAMVASYPDGRKRGDTYQKLKEASKLESERMNLPPDKRGDINKQIKELKK